MQIDIFEAVVQNQLHAGAVSCSMKFDSTTVCSTRIRLSNHMCHIFLQWATMALPTKFLHAV